MLEWRGLWLPDGEQHMVDWMARKNRIVDGKPTYQYHKLEAAMLRVRNWRVAIDVGAHVGLWSMHLAKKFQHVAAFEPILAHRECFFKNCPAEAQMFPYALGEQEQDAKMTVRFGNTGATSIERDGNGDYPVEMRTLDSFAFTEVDFIKLDCEGYELFALRGGEEMLKRWHPCVIVEQKPGRAERFGLPRTEALDYLRGLGAVLQASIGGDYILSWD